MQAIGMCSSDALVLCQVSYTPSCLGGVTSNSQPEVREPGVFGELYSCCAYCSGHLYTWLYCLGDILFVCLFVCLQMKRDLSTSLWVTS